MTAKRLKGILVLLCIEFSGDLTVANTKSAKKRMVQNQARRQHSTSIKSAYRTCLKKAGLAVDVKPETATKLITTLSSIVDKATQKGIIHKNKAARYKRKLALKLKNAK